MRKQGPGELRRNAGANAGSAHEITALVVSDKDRIEDAPIRNITADDELLTTIRPPLDPICGALAGAVLAPRRA